MGKRNVDFQLEKKQLLLCGTDKLAELMISCPNQEVLVHELKQ